MRDTLRTYGTAIGFGFRAAPWHATFQLITGVLMAAGGPVVAYGSKLLIDAAVAGELRAGFTAAVVIGLGIGAILVSLFYYVDCVFSVLERTQALADRELMRLFGGIEGLAHHELPEYLDEAHRIREERGGLAGMTNATAGLLRSLVTSTVTAVLLATVHPALLLLGLLALVSVLINRHTRRLQITAQEATSEPERLRRHLFELGTDSAAGKELRVFGLATEIRDRHHRAASAVRDERTRADWRSARLRTLDALINALAFVAAIVLVLLLALSGRATPGDVVLVIGLASFMSQSVSIAAAYGDQFMRVMRVARRFRWLENYADSVLTEPTDPAPVPARLHRGVDLTAVTFQYPGTERPVLDDVTVQLPAGTVVALVGENGAGKTTLVKLLCGFYRPTHGRIEVDGVDLERVPLERWRQRTSAAFQDHVAFEFLAGETIGIADLDRIDDRPAILAALDRADSADLVIGLPQGLDTQLGTRWNDGVDLSGGQWQKLALARGLLRTEPLLVVFDEPTAALDAQTEHVLFERFATAARVGHQAGAVTLLVSHRFSTVRMADLIVVLDGGRIREVGSHDELMTRGDLYAELYELQSRAYR